MNIQSLYTQGETSLLLDGEAGKLEAILQCPAIHDINKNYLAILGHPHSLYGGTMQNKVVTTLARTFQDLGIPSLRFNFRGVGQSQGAYDAGMGESDDMLFLMQQISQENPQLRFCLAGFSFGSYVTYRAAAKATQSILIGKEHINCLISIAPAVQHYDYTEFKGLSLPWVIVQGEKDDVALPEAVFEWYEHLNPKPQLIKMPETGHFFHSRLGQLKDHLEPILSDFLSVEK